MTYEDVKRIRANPTMTDVDNEELARMIDEAIEKQIPKKPRREVWKQEIFGDGDVWTLMQTHCGVCDGLIQYAGGEECSQQQYCDHCGQAISWEEEQ